MRYQRSGKTMALRSLTASYILALLAVLEYQAQVNHYLIAFTVLLTIVFHVFGFLCLSLLREDMVVHD